MRVDRSRFNWGVFLIVLGGVALAYHQNAISSSVLMDAWRLWPLVLVGIGLKVFLSGTPAAFGGGLVVAISIGIVVGGAFAVGPNVGCGAGGQAGERSASQSGAFSGTSTVELDLKCGTADVTTSTDGRWHVGATNDGNHAPAVNSGPNWLQVQSASADWTCSQLGPELTAGAWLPSFVAPTCQRPSVEVVTSAVPHLRSSSTVEVPLKAPDWLALLSPACPPAPQPTFGPTANALPAITPTVPATTRPPTKAAGVLDMTILRPIPTTIRGQSRQASIRTDEEMAFWW